MGIVVTGVNGGSAVAEGRTVWPRASQERAVERFYQPGIERYEDYHGGMLNFGLWTDGVSDYRRASENLIRRVATSIALRAESRVLDVASGMGAQDVFLAREFGCRSIDGIDVTWKHVLSARRRTERAGLRDRLRFHHGTAVDLPFADSSFTHVLCVEGGAHFDTRERFLKEAFRVLAPGGRIALTDYSMKRPSRTLLDRILVELGRRAWHVPSANLDTVDGLRAKIERARFRRVLIEEAGGDVIPGYYAEGRKPENVRSLSAIRGFVLTRASFWMDAVVFQLYRRGLLEYIFVSAEKPQ